MASEYLDLVEALLNPESAKHAANDVDKRIFAKEREVDELQTELAKITESLAASREGLDRLRQVYEILRAQAGLPSRTGATPGSTADAIIRVLRTSAKPMRAADVHEALGSMQNIKTVRWALWDAAQRGLISRVGQGLYAMRGEEE